MTNDEKLKRIHQDIKLKREANRNLLAQTQQVQSALEGLDVQRKTVLREHASGDPKAPSRIDVLDAEEKNLRRQLEGSLLLIAENDATVASLHSEAAPIEAQLQTEQLHAAARVTTARIESRGARMIALMESLANELASFGSDVTELYELCGERSDTVDYRNRSNHSAETVNGFKARTEMNLANGVWKRPPATHPSAFVPRVLTINAVIVPESAQGQAA